MTDTPSTPGSSTPGSSPTPPLHQPQPQVQPHEQQSQQPQEQQSQQPPPPPPPPSLTAPPGYTYNPTYVPNAYGPYPTSGNPYPYGGARLSSVRTLGMASAILIGVVVISRILSYFVLTRPLTNKAEEMIDGQITAADFLAASRNAGVSALGSMAYLAAIVVTIIWMYRIAANNQIMGRVGTWSPLWTIFGWLIVPGIPIVPTLAIQQMWQSDDPNADQQTWRKAPTSPLIWAWGAVYSAGTLLGLAIGANTVREIMNSFGRRGGARDLTEYQAQLLVDTQWYNMFALVSSTITGVLFIIIIRQLTARHTHLTGEQQS